MHDGSARALGAVLDHGAAGGRAVDAGPSAGGGAKNRRKSPLVNGFALSAGERRAGIALLESLTDERFLTDRRFGDPRARTKR